MNMRAGWTYNGKRFRETFDLNGRKMCFIDGKQVACARFYVELAAAKEADPHPNHFWFDHK